MKEKSCFVKTTKKTATKVRTKPPVNPTPKKQKAVSSTKKISLIPNESGIEPKVITENPSDKVNVLCSPAKQPNDDTVVLGSKSSALEDNVSSPVFEVPSQLAISPASKDIRHLKNSTDVGSHVVKQNLNLKPSVITSTSSITNLPNKMVVSSGTQDSVIFSSPIMSNYNPPVVLASSNSGLQSTQWLTTPVQPTWPNTVTYFIMPTGAVNQVPVYLATSANTLSTILPTVTTMSLTTATPAATVSTVNSSVVKLPSTAMTTTMPLTTAMTTTVSLSTAMTTTVSLSTAMTTTMSLTTAMTSTTSLSTAMTTTASMPGTVMTSQMANTCNQFLAKLPLKTIVPKSTFVQLPFQSSSLLNQQIDVLSKKQPTASQFKTLKILNQIQLLENENGVSETQSSVNGPSGNIANQQTSQTPAGNPLSSVVNDEKVSKDSASFGNDAKNNETVMLAAELPETVQEKNNQTNKTETSGDEDISKEIHNVSCLENSQFILVPMKKPRGRPKKSLVVPKYEKRKEIPILPATGNMEGGHLIKPQSFNLLPSGNYVISFVKEINDGSLSKNQSDEEVANVSQYESNKLLTYDKENNGNGTDMMMMNKSSLCEEKEMHNLSSQDQIIMKTEPLDDYSEVNQKEFENWSDNRPSSTSPFTADIQNKRSSKEEKNLENDLTPLQEGEENELVISSCFSFSVNTKSGLSLGSDTKSNEADMSAAELIKTIEEKTIDSELSTKSNPTNKLETSDEDIPEEIDNESQSENNQIVLLPMKKPRGQSHKSLVVPKYEKRKEIPILPATGKNTEKEHSTKLQSFNLLPRRNFLIPFHKEVNDGSLSKNQSDEEVANVSQYESNKLLTYDKENNGNGTDMMMMNKSSLCEEKEMHNLSSQDQIIMKTEPLDDYSEVNQKEFENWSDNRPSSSSPFTADIQNKRLCKEEKNSENDLTPLQEGEENELVISSCFSLSNHTESQKKLFPFSSVHSAFDNLFFLPSKTDSDVERERSTNLSEEIKLKDCSVRLEQLIFPSNPQILSSLSFSEEENGVKNGKSSCTSSSYEDEMNVKTLDSSATPAKGTKRSFQDPAKSIKDQECFKKLKENYLSVDQIPHISNREINKIALKSKSESVSKNLLIQDFINKSLKKSLKSSSALPSNDDSLIVDLTKDEETDTFIEGCIAFHQHQLYLLQLQMDQHKTALEKLKKAQNYLKGIE